MNSTPDLTESRIAAGIKTAAVVVLLGLIAVVAQPHRMADEVIPHASAASAPAPATVSDTSYLPAQFPAPTTVTEQPPTF